MKKVFLVVPALVLVLGSCKTSQTLSYDDDVYANPTEERRLAKIAAEEKAKKEAEEKRKQEEERLAQKAKDDANPYYKDPDYNSDDYYDYKYASNIRRFNNPINGAGYYDNYYTNSYYYNQNPNCYGSSIYNSYNYLMPSYQFGNYGNSISYGIGYSPYGYNSWNSPYGYGNGTCWNGGYGNYGYGYSNYGYGYPNYGYGYGYPNYGYGYGYPNYGYGYGYPYGGYYNNGYGYGSGSGSGWGYYNSYDPNSGYSKYGARGSNGGGNSTRNTTAGMEVPEEYKNRVKFMEDMANKQESTPRFIDVPKKRINNSGSENVNSPNYNGDNTTINGGYVKGGGNNGSNTNIDSNPKGGYTKSESSWPSIFTGNSSSNNGSGNSSENNNSNTNSNPRHGATRVNGGTENGSSNNTQNTNRENNSGGWGSWPSSGSGSGSGSSGSTSPRGTGGGTGGSKPR